MVSRVFFAGVLSLIVLFGVTDPATAQITWDLVEDGITNPATNPVWDLPEGGSSTLSANHVGTTPTGDNRYMSIVSTGTKVKIRQEPSSLLTGVGTTVRMIMRLNSGGNLGNYGLEHVDAFGTMEVGWEKFATSGDGKIRFINRTSGNIEITVPNINTWHVYWFVHHTNGNTYFWLDPDASDNSIGTADLVRPDGGDTGNRLTWGTESSGQDVDQDFDDIRWVTGIHFPSEEPPPIVATPTPSITPTPTLSPTPTIVPNNPRIELTMLRQVGCHENDNMVPCGGTGGNRALYIHLSHMDGRRLSGADCYMRVNGGGETFIGQTGSTDITFPDFLEHSIFDTFTIDEVEVRVAYQGASSDYTPILYRDVPPANYLYSWEMHFVYVPDTVTFPTYYEYFPQDRAYDYAHVKLNTSSGIVNDPPDFDYQSDFRDTIQVGAASTTYSQTFIAEGNRVIAAKAFVTTEFLTGGGELATARYRASIHEGGPSGPQIGGTRFVPQYFSFEYPKVSAFWPFEGPDSVPVVPGQTYALKVTKENNGFSGNTFSLWTSQFDSYPDGDLYKDGVLVSPAQDMVGIVITANSWPVGGTPTPTFPPPQTGVEAGWKAYY